MKKRIYELSKELGIDNKDLLKILADLGVNVKSALNVIDEEVEEIVKELVLGKTEITEEKAEKPETPPVEKEERKVQEETVEVIELPKEEKKEKVLKIQGSMRVKDLAEALSISPTELIMELLNMKILANVNQMLDPDIIKELAKKHDYKVEEVKPQVSLKKKILSPEEEARLKSRPPVVVVMGHVDHGKTTLLDAIRQTKVAEKEYGGITQHIGASMVEHNGRKIVFLDTPGHEAFTALRARGAQVTDIAVLVVAADDGVMPQTIEAINHAKAANVPIIVAINKIDKPEANPERVKQQLSEYGLIPEEWGGDTIMVPISAKRKQGIDQLLEMILLLSDILELKADPDKPAKGAIIETKMDKGRGPVATVIIQEGTLRLRDVFVAGNVMGRVRTMFDDKGRPLKEALPSWPVEVSGFDELPQAGDILEVVENEEVAKAILEERKQKKETSNIEVWGLGEKILPIIVKADTQGSLEAILQTIDKMHTEDITIKVIHSGVGGITESDVMLASASKGIIIGFNVRPDSKAQQAIAKEKVIAKTYRIIYEIIEDLQNYIKGLKEPQIKEVIIGKGEVKATFNVPKVGTVAGVYVREGKIQRNAKVRLIRDGKIIYDGRIASLKRFKDDVNEVLTNFECGVGLENFGDIKPGDILEVYVLQQTQ
ncbi:MULTISPECIES: translation initiation factor IF-2 [Dictyoglomus]|uniref:Translation initiation factor IF-2 n=1 Tax=Dictyoglomus turgidum (strain DSM 6724 / Z-1310) TaxID=515635 RepID=B8E2Y7_DICTD|nr:MULTISPECIES: translation initiation factor IF-2 [Dictyoglomus]ACK42487.1 translation initiation factor IF-2 [Dictyoglomus turgidum DSM 6724]HBU32056.1 translation initiation factor IF-2 [Dictyoglomus sp.]